MIQATVRSPWPGGMMVSAHTPTTRSGNVMTMCIDGIDLIFYPLINL